MPRSLPSSTAEVPRYFHRPIVPKAMLASHAEWPVGRHCDPARCVPCHPRGRLIHWHNLSNRKASFNRCVRARYKNVHKVRILPNPTYDPLGRQQLLPLILIRWFCLFVAVIRSGGAGSCFFSSHRCEKGLQRHTTSVDRKERPL